jgi:hypothetical protein
MQATSSASLAPSGGGLRDAPNQRKRNSVPDRSRSMPADQQLSSWRRASVQPRAASTKSSSATTIAPLPNRASTYGL